MPGAWATVTNPDPTPQTHGRYKMLYDTVRQELEERGVSFKVAQQLAPTVVGVGAGFSLLGPLYYRADLSRRLLTSKGVTPLLHSE